MFYAVLLGKYFSELCKRGGTGNIHSVFERAINVELAEEGLFTLLAGGAGGNAAGETDIMPASCIAAAPAGSWEKIIRTGSGVLLTPDIVYVENIPVVGNISAAALWEKLSTREINDLTKPAYAQLLTVCEELENYLDKTGKGETLPTPPLCDFKAENFIGAGLGLTPSGDDFLAGMLHGIHFMESLYGKKCPYLPKITRTISANLQGAGTISRHFLSFALNGEWGRSTENVLVRLVSGDKQKLYNAVNAKLAYGASSGADELRGCLFGIRENLMSTTPKPV